jgi:hypothetical protein
MPPAAPVNPQMDAANNAAQTGVAAPDIQDLYAAMTQLGGLLNQQQPELMRPPDAAIAGKADLAQALLGRPLPGPQGVVAPGGLGQFLVPVGR